jgi:5-methylcytosine-specific restriction protein A
MPYKPPKIGQSPYDASWRKQRMALLREQPLCRLCLAAGRTVAAAVVDHIVPLRDGGTNTTDNLQPLCKRCHDAVKTPADLSARRNKERSSLTLICVSLNAEAVAGFDWRVIRRQAAARFSWQQAHRLMLSAAEGVISAWSGGLLSDLKLTISLDDAAWCKQAAGRWKIPVVTHEVGAIPDAVTDEQAWLASRWSTEYGVRHGTNDQGPQPPTADL